MQRFITSKVAANNLRKNQLSFNTMRAFAAGPKANPFDGVKTSLGGSAFYKLPSLGDSRLGKYDTRLKLDLFLTLLLLIYRDPPILYQSSP